VLLADGTSLGDVRGGVGYQDLSGVIGNSLKAIQMMRSNVIQSNEQTGNAVLPIALPFDSEELFDKVQEVINSRSQKTKKEDAKASSVSSSESEMNENKSEGNTLSNNGYGSVKGEEATKPMKRPASQESSSSNGSILNGDIYAAVKDETKPMKYNASQEESSLSNDSILDLEIFSSKTAKSRSRQNININAADRGSSRNDSNNVIDLSFDDDDDVAMQQM